jgi:hypothetical protein
MSACGASEDWLKITSRGTKYKKNGGHAPASIRLLSAGKWLLPDGGLLLKPGLHASRRLLRESRLCTSDWLLR